MAKPTAAAPVTELTGPLATLKEKFGEALKPGDYEGVVIAADRLIEVATFIRDELGYDHLTNLTGVDYIAQNEMEVVCHALNTRAGGAPHRGAGGSRGQIGGLVRLPRLCRRGDLPRRRRRGRD